ncbi:asparagine synthase (glutamine-hydrolyzing) [Actinacidiphila acidipaludis]|uniref:asparagine synthase (glutamine-hydrolyzing) n=1 Tax=Actinacidiphila acidipaludis TaxID=2873382 RepID=A0ABS7QE40_9ACTN|nr:asparagine synthase (glutamine-hydrolyzing) [Streptomyces acidipaludis]MBY8881439.1 asparagine synthase (glutamine-hydrolyzing) [Streptomyces acidipaludis]
MCGIAGWVDPARNLRDHGPLLERMTATIHRRGPDAQGVWTGEHAAFGHRRLAVIDLEHGGQPMTATAGGREYVLTFSGEIYNYRALREELAQRGHSFRTASDTEVLLRSYLEWGTACVARLEGMFAFAVWDPRHGRLLLGRDRLGIKPLYYARAGTGIVFGSEPKVLLASGQVAPEVDAAGLREVLDMVKTPGAAVFRGMRELPPGHYLTLDSSGTTEHRYWALEATEHTDSLPDTVGRVRDLLEQVVGDQLVSDVPRCTLLSGGLDSSAITAIAAAALRPETLRTFAVDFASAAESFAQDAVRRSPDFPHARALAEHLGTDHHEVLLDGDRLLDPDVRTAVLTATDLPPAYWGDMWPSLLLLFDEVKRHSTVALSGEGADELFGGYQWFFNPAAVDGDTFPWLTSGSSRYFGGLKLFDRGFLDGLHLAEARRQSYLDAVAVVPVLDGEAPEEARMRRVGHLNLTRFLQTLLDRKDRMSMGVGLEVRVPFCDHRLVEYVFNIPWRLKSFDGREKSVLRESVRDLLPASILDRKKNPYPAIQDGGYESGLRKMLLDVVHEPSSPVLPLLDRAKVDAQLQRDSTAVSLPYSRGSMEMCLWLNAWLERYGVALAL